LLCVGSQQARPQNIVIRKALKKAGQVWSPNKKDKPAGGNRVRLKSISRMPSIRKMTRKCMACLSYS